MGLSECHTILLVARCLRIPLVAGRAIVPFLQNDMPAAKPHGMGNEEWMSCKSPFHEDLSMIDIPM